MTIPPNKLRPWWFSLLATLFLLAPTALAVAQLPNPVAAKAPLRVDATAAERLAEPGMNRLIIGFRPEANSTKAIARSASAAQEVEDLNQVQALAAGAAGQVTLRFHKSVALRTHVALTSRRMSRGELVSMARRLQLDPRVAFAEVDERVQPQFVPTDPEFDARQWTMQATTAMPVPVPPPPAGAANLPPAWDLATGAGVIVAVLDGGYVGHADLMPNILAGYDFVSADPSGVFFTSNDGDGRDGDARDPGDWNTSNQCPRSNSSWHGTHVTGIIGAAANNAGVVGAAFNAKILPVRVLGVCGGYVSDITAGMRWAAGLTVPGVPTNTQIAKILNLSLGRIGNCSAAFREAVNDVRAVGSIVVAATGNDAAGSILQPANCPGVIAVTAHTVDGDNASYANIGHGTAISAPGGGNGATITGDGRLVVSTGNTGTTTPQADSLLLKRGTSMATAHVSAVAALMAALKPDITPDELFSRLTNSARIHPPGSHCAALFTCGAGLLDAGQAVAQVDSDDAPVVGSRYSPDGVAQTGATVQLIGTATAGQLGGPIVALQWIQLAGPSVALSGANSQTASFVVPPSGSNFVFRFSATDNQGNTATSQLVVPAHNTAPVMDPVPAQFVAVGARLQFTVRATDAEADAIVFAAGSLPVGATFDAGSGLFDWENAGPAGSYVVDITPSDGQLNGPTEFVRIEVGSAGGGGGGGGAFGWLDVSLLILALAAALAIRYLRATGRR